jgi:hypothetical protein
VDRSGIGLKLADYRFELLLHAATLAGGDSRRQLLVRHPGREQDTVLFKRSRRVRPGLN